MEYSLGAATILDSYIRIFLGQPRDIEQLISYLNITCTDLDHELVADPCSMFAPSGAERESTRSVAEMALWVFLPGFHVLCVHGERIRGSSSIHFF